MFFLIYFSLTLYLLLPQPCAGSQTEASACRSVPGSQRRPLWQTPCASQQSGDSLARLQRAELYAREGYRSVFWNLGLLSLLNANCVIFESKNPTGVQRFSKTKAHTSIQFNSTQVFLYSNQFKKQIINHPKGNKKGLSKIWQENVRHPI